MVRARILRVIL
jgi:hypothetical protein